MSARGRGSQGLQQNYSLTGLGLRQSRPVQEGWYLR
eukprot:gene716-1017_t